MRSITANTKPGRVALLAYDGLAMFEFSVACEVFGPTESDTLGVDWYEFVVCGDQSSVRFDNGLTLHVPRRLRSLSGADTVIVPPCEDASVVSDSTLSALRRAHARGARIISLCTGALVLARTGLLDGRRAVTHWQECSLLATSHPSVEVDSSVLYIDDGDILTSAGSAASIDLCLHVVQVDHGAEVAARLARQLVVPLHRDGGQAQYIELPMPDPVRDEPFSETMAWLAQHLDDVITVEELADRSAMSPRSFARRFAAATGTTPYQWLLRRRVQHAQQLLEASDLPVEAIAARTGLGNSANLRKHFRRHVGASPAGYRATFRSA